MANSSRSMCFARLLVRSMIPEAIPGSSMEDVVTAKADYSKLDEASRSVRMRLNSTVVHVQHTNTAKEVQVAYARGGKVQTITAKNCVLACYNGMIPYICPELPEKQKEALSYLVKMPLLYTHVALRNWTGKWMPVRGHTRNTATAGAGSDERASEWELLEQSGVVYVGGIEDSSRTIVRGLKWRTASC